MSPQTMAKMGQKWVKSSTGWTRLRPLGNGHLQAKLVTLGEPGGENGENQLCVRVYERERENPVFLKLLLNTTIWLLFLRSRTMIFLKSGRRVLRDPELWRF